MNNIEKRLEEEKKRIQTINAPDDLEMRLRSALHKTKQRKTRRTKFRWSLIAATLFCTLTIGYHYNALAFYSKKIFGFDSILTDTLKELNDEGMGQIINKEIELADETTFTINGIIADSNQLIMYYTLTNEKGLDLKNDPITFASITGFFTSSSLISSSGLLNEEKTELKGTMSFGSVNPFAKELTLHFREETKNNQQVERSIDFSYNPNKAMQAKVKQSINKTFKADKGTVTFKSITATPTLTVVKGSLNVDNFDRVNESFEGIELIANGEPIELTGSSNSSTLIGDKFEIRYDALPKQLDSLQLVIKEFAGYETLHTEIPLTMTKNDPIMLANKELWIKNVANTSRGVEVTIATDDDMMLDGVSIKGQNTSVSLQTTVMQNDKKQENAQMMKERTLLFDTTIKPEYLVIDGMHYMKAYDEVVEIVID
ncbi:DUF4179 domain-containing protein [Priestia taiwanensis]|uniref:DUF4179 domain-containing protein n=1 Tax=Priestia taiwanensis TaxID=1347902 RepID=A0A917ANC4_9BACI|nr:DUF4179 domain-containing protein [Priestia taiwanensis]MBM7362332.1 hypothetical protein [Priestia taiwanensis]GGE61313.1 hypothetical protein GCM10007140_09550 [Priestia taiwanensis]